ncbi:hypothetical protein Esti_004392 [Eimeria stiedai]
MLVTSPSGAFTFQKQGACSSYQVSNSEGPPRGPPGHSRAHGAPHRCCLRSEERDATAAALRTAVDEAIPSADAQQQQQQQRQQQQQQQQQHSSSSSGGKASTKSLDPLKACSSSTIVGGAPPTGAS